jgi:hypothetical protein
MKNQKIIFYGFKWFAFVFLSVLTAQESNSKIMLFLLMGFVAVLLIWEGIKDFKTDTGKTEKGKIAG